MPRQRWVYYLVGIVAGCLTGAGLSVWTKHSWFNGFGFPCGILCAWLAERKGLILSREEELRPTTLFSGNTPPDSSKSGNRSIG
jgi:hypothetical protein